jgi:hypothetical protein
MATPSSPPPWPPTGGPRQPRRWPTVAWPVVVVLVAAVAIVGWLRPLSGHKPSAAPAPSYTDQQIGNAKASVCAAFEKIDHAVDLSDAERANSSDRTAQLAAAALGRQVLDFGSRYLLAKLAEEPATPSELASAIRQQANAYQDLFIGYIDGVSNTDQVLKSTVTAATETTTKIQQLCK